MAAEEGFASAAERRAFVEELQLNIALEHLPCPRPCVLERDFFAACLPLLQARLGGIGVRLEPSDGGFSLAGDEAAVEQLRQSVGERVRAAGSGQSFAHFLQAMLRRLKRTLAAAMPWFREDMAGFLDTLRLEQTGQEGGYQGDFLLEYEINPAAGGDCIYWPDVSRFSDAHRQRYTLGRPERVVEFAVFNVLCDMPHEIVHLVQRDQDIKPDPDDGWLAEHDPSVCAHNLLHRALASDASADGWDAPGLFETVRLWAAKRLADFAAQLPDTVEAEYAAWRSSGGHRKPDVDSASEAADYLKLRAAFEAYPIDVEHQLAALFRHRRGDVRTLGPPDQQAFISPDSKSFRELLQATSNHHYSDEKK